MKKLSITLAATIVLCLILSLAPVILPTHTSATAETPAPGGVYFVTGTIADYGWGNGQDSRWFIENTFDWLWPTMAGSGSILLVWDNTAWSNAWKQEMAGRSISWTEKTGASLTAADLNVSLYRLVIIAEHMYDSSMANMESLVGALETYMGSGGVVVDMIGSNNVRRWSRGVPGPYGVTTDSTYNNYNYVAAVGHPMVTNMATPYFYGGYASHANIVTPPTGATTLLTAGTSSGGAIIASYLGDAPMPTPTPTTNSQTKLAASPRTSTYGQSVTFTATVNPNKRAGTPTGTVTFMDGDTVIASDVPLVGKKASFSTNNLTVGSHVITAAYSGDDNFNESTSTLSQLVKTARTSTSVTSSANPSSYEDSVAFSATVSTATGLAVPTGTITFKDGSRTLGTAELDGSGQATYKISSLSIGWHRITAVYSGDSNFSSSISRVIKQIVIADIR